MSEDFNSNKRIALDFGLGMGYFRMGKDLFTTNQVYVGDYGNSGQYDPVFWLRLNLKKAKETNTTKRIRKKCSGFTFKIEPAEITNEIESLYSHYLSSVNFDGYPSCKDCIPSLHEPEDVFDTYMIKIFDQNQLIAVGFFDRGEKSLMSVLHFYHPNYKRFSLGKFLMLLTMDFAKDANMDFVYPGYITINGTKMDYKVFPQVEAMEVFLSKDNNWAPLENHPKKELDFYYFKQLLGIDFDNLEEAFN